jgi:hypothetical protein
VVSHAVVRVRAKRRFLRHLQGAVHFEPSSFRAGVGAVSSLSEARPKVNLWVQHASDHRAAFSDGCEESGFFGVETRRERGV